jgi:PAS domain S-box-containing protein
MGGHGKDADPSVRQQAGSFHVPIRHGTVLLGGIFILSIAVTRLLYDNFERERDQRLRVTHNYQVLEQIQAFTSGLETSVNAQRGYLLTGDRNYLEQFESDLRGEAAAGLALRGLMSEHPSEKMRLDALDRLVTARSAILRESISVRQSGVAAAGQIRSGETQRMTDQCRATLRVMEEAEQKRLAKDSASAEDLALRSRWMLGLGRVSLLMLLLVAGAAVEKDRQAREKARRALADSEERLRLALESAHAGTWEWDLRSNENVWSEELWKLYGLEPHSCRPTYEAWLGMIHPDDRERAGQVVREAASTGSKLSVEFRLSPSPGGVRWILARGRPLPDGLERPQRFIGLALDITQRKLAEEAGLEREQNLRHFTEAAPVAIAMFDREMRYLAASRRFRDDYRLGSLQLTGRSHYEVFPELPEAWREIHRRCLAGATERHLGEKFIRANGLEQWIRWEIQPWRDGGGAVAGIVLFSEDISEQKGAEIALRNSEARLRLAQQAAQVGTFEWNIQTGAITWTPELEAIHGLAPGEFDGTLQAWENLVDPDDLFEARRRLERAMETGKFEAEWRIRRAGTVERRIAARASVLKDEGGSPLRMIGVNIDITELRLAEAAAGRWQRAFEQAELAIALSDSAAGTLQVVNVSFARQRGYAACELADRPIVELFPASQRSTVWHSVKMADREGHATFESEHERKDGSRFPIRVDLTVVRNEAGNPVSRVAFVHDLTAQKKAEQEIRQLNSELEERVRERTAQLEAANRELEAFSYSVSHDLRAPLRGIDGWSQALAEDYSGQLDERALQYLGRVRSEAQRMRLLIDDLLQLSRVSRSALDSVPVDLTAMADEIAANLQETHVGRRIRFDIQPELSTRGDPGFLKIALTNLLGNAVKFSGTREEARIEFRLSQNGGIPAFCVRDNGVGFDMAYADSLFGAFQRLHQSSDFPGTGIGLAIVQRVIHRHGGRVWAHARTEEGASFYFTIGAGA